MVLIPMNKHLPDCLKLNVWKPTDAKEGDKLPVVVYIHVSVISLS